MTISENTALDTFGMLSDFIQSKYANLNALIADLDSQLQMGGFDQEERDSVTQSITNSTAWNSLFNPDTGQAAQQILADTAVAVGIAAQKDLSTVYKPVG